MRKAAEILERDKDKFAHLMTLEMGKPYKAAVAEAVKSAGGCRYYAENAERFLTDEVIETGAKKSFIRYRPIGPILAVMPWNFPFWQVFRFAAPALMAGNVGLLKHASNVPQCALAIERIFLEAGFPQGAFQTLLIGSQQVDAILNDPRVVAATLTGSEQAGIQVGIAAAKRIKKVVLELGGSDPFIVMPSANLDAAVATAVEARVINNGQSCIAAKRFIVAEPIAAEFERKFVDRMKNLRVGDPFDEKTELGPLATADAVTSLDADVQKTVRAGAKLLTGGHPLKQARQLLCAHGFNRHSERIAQPIAKNSSVLSPRYSASKISTKPSASPTTAASASAPAPGPPTTASANASSTNSNRAWSSSTRWSPPIPASLSAASSSPDTAANWPPTASANS